MNKKIKLIAGVLSFILVIVGVYFLYNKLSSQFSTDSIVSGKYNEDNKTADIAPDFTVTNSQGEQIKLSDLKGKPVVINFWATWCHYCKVEMPDFEEMYKKYGNEVEFMMVNMTDGQRETILGAKSFIKEHGFTFPIYFDIQMSAANAYSVTSLPATYFVNANGELVAAARGAADSEAIEKGINMIK